MNLWQTSMKRAVLVLLAAAVVTSAAQAAQPAGRAGASSSDRPVAGYSPQELMAMSISHPWVPGFRARYHAQAKKIALQELAAISNSHPHVSTSHLKELMATANNSVPRAIVSLVNVQKPVLARSDGAIVSSVDVQSLFQPGRAGSTGATRALAPRAVSRSRSSSRARSCSCCGAGRGGRARVHPRPHDESVIRGDIADRTCAAEPNETHETPRARSAGTWLEYVAAR